MSHFNSNIGYDFVVMNETFLVISKHGVEKQVGMKNSR